MTKTPFTHKIEVLKEIPLDKFSMLSKGTFKMTTRENIWGTGAIGLTVLIEPKKTQDIVLEGHEYKFLIDEGYIKISKVFTPFTHEGLIERGFTTYQVIHEDAPPTVMYEKRWADSNLFAYTRLDTTVSFYDDDISGFDTTITTLEDLDIFLSYIKHD